MTSLRGDRDFTQLGRALATPARSAIVNVLMDGTIRPAGELARAADVSASAASDHLRILVEAGVITCEARGRGRFYRLASAEVATALESLGALAPPVAIRGYTRSREAEELTRARLCYDHLAGRLGTRIADAWTELGWLVGRDDLALSEVGAGELRRLGVDVEGARAVRRVTTRSCLDWTERRAHLAGALGAAVATRFFEAGWVSRRTSGRGLHVTDSGQGLLELWRIQLDDGPQDRVQLPG